MFLDFLYLLRKRGIQVSTQEWLTLMEAMEKGLIQNSLSEFYSLARACLVKSEADYDCYDQAFLEYFKDIASAGEIADRFWDYLAHPATSTADFKGRKLPEELRSFQELWDLLQERLREQKEEHHGGNYWIGTGGTSPFGHSGYHDRGFRIGEKEGLNRGLHLAAGRAYRDFREDVTISDRQFSMAFRKLRQMSSRDQALKTELDLDETIRKTGDNAGFLKLAWQPPRKNSLRLLILFDSGGSMEAYAELSSKLFQAINAANHFADLKTYYFHNLPYNKLYHTPGCVYSKSVDTDWAIRHLSADYRVILVGDASMAPWEMEYYNGIGTSLSGEDYSGKERLRQLREKFKHIIWLNPIPENRWMKSRGSYTIRAIGQEVPMYQLSVEGMEKGIRSLLVSR